MRVFLTKRLSLIAAAVIALPFILSLPAANGAYGEILSAQRQSSSVQTPVALPVRLKIPRIKVNAAIQYVGLTPSGAVDVPKGRTDVAWYKLGPRPGEAGSAVIVGHRGAKPGPATVFDNLYKLSKGDVVYVQDAKGKSISFIVREVHTYVPDANVPEVFTSASGIHLNLVTCDGVWNRSAEGFTKRLVVFTDIKN